MAGLGSLYSTDEKAKEKGVGVEEVKESGLKNENISKTKFDSEDVPKIDEVKETKPTTEEGFGIGEANKTANMEVDLVNPDDRDDFLTGLISPKPEEETLSIPIGNKMLYRVKANNEEVARTIEKAISEQTNRVSFSTEELGLNNRLLNLDGIKREGNNYYLVKAPKGHIIVVKNRDRGNLDEFSREATECAKAGKRITIKLTEEYEVEDEHGRKLTRERFRASIGEIEGFIRGTKMNGQITHDSFLIIYE